MSFREARKEAGKSITETAAALGISRQSIHGFEHGKYKPSADVLVKMAAFYRCTVDKLLAEDTDNAE